MLLCVFPKAERARNMHIQRANNTKLRNLNTVVKNRVIFLRNSFLLFAEDEHTARREFKFVQHF